MSSVYVVCWIFLQTFQTYLCIQANSVDPDRTDRDPHFFQTWLLKSQADDKADDKGKRYTFRGGSSVKVFFSYWVVIYSIKTQFSLNQYRKTLQLSYAAWRKRFCPDVHRRFIQPDITLNKYSEEIM